MTTKSNDLLTTPHGEMPLKEVLHHLGTLLQGETVNDNELQINNALCTGIMRGEELAPGIEMISWQAQLHKPAQLVRNPGGSAPVWAILLTDSPRIQASRQMDTTAGAPPSNVGAMAYLYNHHLAINMFFQDSGPVRLLLIRLKTAAWEHILVEQSPRVRAFIQSQEPQFHGLSINQTLLDDFSKLMSHKPSPNRATWSSLATSINICSEVFSQLNQRGAHPQKGMRSKDAERLYRAHSLLLADFHNPLSIEAICKQVGLGRDKFRQLFQQVYGTTPFQYFQQQRMEEARRLIASGEHSVMDAGYLVGYSHLGHFSQAFKKQFGYLPKEIKPK